MQTIELKSNNIAVPTSAAELAKVVKFFIDNDDYGTYHAVCRGGSCTRQEFANEILRLSGNEGKLTVTVADNAIQKYSVLDNLMLRITGIAEPGDWRETLAAYIKETGGVE